MNADVVICKKCNHNCHCAWDQCDECTCETCDCGSVKSDIPDSFLTPTNT